MALFARLVKAVKKMFKTPRPRRHLRRQKKRSAVKRARSKTRTRTKRRVAAASKAVRPSARKSSTRKAGAVPKATPRIRSVTAKTGRPARATKHTPNPSGRPQRLGHHPLTKGLPPGKASAAVAKKAAPPAPELLIGEITHYFSKIMVVVLKITGHPIKVGDTIHVKGHSSDFAQKVASLQIESVNVPFGKKGQLVGLKVVKQARVGDQVFRGEKTK